MSKALELAKFGREVPPTGLVVGDSDTQTLSAKTFSDSPIFSSGVVDGVGYLNGSKALTTNSNLTFNGTLLTVSDIRDSSLTSGRITYAGTGGNLVDSANLVFSGTHLGVGTSTPKYQTTGIIAGITTLTVFNSAADGGGIELATGSATNTAAAGRMLFVASQNTNGSRGIAAIDSLIQGTTSSNQGGLLRFFTKPDNGSLTTRMLLDSEGNVGVGEGNPAAYGRFTVTAAGVGIHANSSSGAAGIHFYENGQGRFGFRTLNGSAGVSFFDTFNSVERMRITNAGNISFGSTGTADRPVHLIGTGTRQYFRAETTTNSISNEAGFDVKTPNSNYLIGSHGSTNALWIYDINAAAERLRIDSVGNLLVGGPGNTGGGKLDLPSNATAVIQARSTAAGTGDGSTDVSVIRAVSSTANHWANARYDAFSHTWGHGGSATANIAMRLTGNGNLALGTTSNVTEKLNINGAAWFIANNDANYSTIIAPRYDSSWSFTMQTRLNSTTFTEWLGIYSDGGGGNPRLALTLNGWRVGVGTSNPLHRFQVNNPSNTGRIAAFINTTAGTTTSTDSGFIHIGGAQAGAYYGVDIGFVNNGISPSIYQSSMVFRTAAGEETPQERMRIAHNGFVGINTSSPAHLLDVRSANVSGATGATIRVGSQHHGGSGDEFANLEFFWGDLDGPEVKTKIYAKNVGNVGPGGGGAADLLFATRPAGGDLTERMRIDSAGIVTVNGVTLGRIQTDILAMWRTSDLEGRSSFYSDGGNISYSWDNGILRMDSSIGSHNWDIGKVRLPAGSYQIVFAYRPSPTQHGWNVYGTNSNGHVIRLQTDAGYNSLTTLGSATAFSINKDLQYSITYTSGVITIASDSTLRVGMTTDPYSGGGFKYYIESAYIIRVR